MARARSRPRALVLLILMTIHALNTVDVILVVTGGGPMRLTETMAFHMYKEAFYDFNVGTAPPCP